MPKYYIGKDEVYVKGNASKRRKYDDDLYNDVGIVHYSTTSTGLTSPPGYSPKRVGRRPIAKEIINLNDGSLFDMCLKFMSQNVDLIDSLVGLPEIVGEQLFTCMLRNRV